MGQQITSFKYLTQILQKQSISQKTDVYQGHILIQRHRDLGEPCLRTRRKKKTKPNN